MPRVGIGYNFYFDKRFHLDFSGNLGFSLDKKYEVGDLEPIKNIKLHVGLGLKFSYRISKAKE
jgi:hypothetical protein